ncbi:DNA polymerase III subunit delta [Aestuariibius sp. HNIBRBA575]|uniref:DNA polymerase III subunit delta n=1 Tax=Aestuariibius sp. HNIBRBA575 TaxID=3233343 RepID=UPI0034A5D224
MKLSTREASGYFRKPNPDSAGLLIFGSDPMRVADGRTRVISALIGPQGEEEMRLTRIPAADLRKDLAMLNDAIKAQGFFPGPRVAFVEDATDTLAPTIIAGLTDWVPGDAQIIVTAGQLTAKSKLRKAFEGHKQAFAVGLYDEPPSREDIEEALRLAGLKNIDRESMEALTNLSRDLQPGDFRQTVDKIGLFKYQDDTPLTVEDVAACAPQSSEADLDDVLHIVAEARTSDIAPILRKLYAQGVNPVGLCIGATRHFRRLHVAASDPGGAAQGVGRLRPPVFGPRRDKIVRQASHWGRNRLEKALTLLTDTDLQLRSAALTPQQALVERALIRLSMMARR